MTKPTLPLLPKKINRVINLIVIHCSATVSGRKISSDYKTAAQAIDSAHLQRGFERRATARSLFNKNLSAIGYHFVIDLDGTIQTGRSLNEVGAHAKGFNANSIGICLVGGYERMGRYTPKQWASLKELVKALSFTTHVPLEVAKRNSNTEIKDGICGHRDLSPDLNNNGIIEPTEWTKTCPGFNVSAWLNRGMTPPIGHTYTEELK